MPSCHNCGAPASDAAAFCTTCGAQLHDPHLFSPAAASASATPEAPLTPAIVGKLPENIAGMLAYLVLPAAAFLCLEPYKRNRFVRFHSFQCLFTAGALLSVHIVLGILMRFLPLLILPLYVLLLLADFTLFLLLMLKAYRYEIFKLPYVGDLAQQRADAVRD